MTSDLESIAGRMGDLLESMREAELRSRISLLIKVKERLVSLEQRTTWRLKREAWLLWSVLP